MLNVWKQTWKDSQITSSKLDEPGSSTSSLDVAEAVNPSDTLTPPSTTAKRRAEEQNLLVRKRLKPRTKGPGSVSDVDPTWVERIIDRVQDDNTTFIVPRSRSIAVLLARVLTWMNELEQQRRKSSINRHRTALLVVDDPSSLDFHMKSIVEKSLLRVGVYKDSVHDPESRHWAKFLEHDVVVITSMLLLDSLKEGVLAITQIHSLVICDAQNILQHKSRDSDHYVQIMEDFYHIADTLYRPHIVAIASVPDELAEADFVAIDLQKILGITPKGRAKISSIPDQDKHEVVLSFHDAPRPAPSTLLDQLCGLELTETLYREDFEAAQDALDELGPCASDLVWRRTQSRLHATLASKGGPHDTNGAAIRATIKNWVFTMPNLDPTSHTFNVTPKVVHLMRVLEACKPYADAFRGIIFVKSGTIAAILTDLLSAINEIPFLRPYALVDAQSESHRQEVLAAFSSGAYNLLVTPATKGNSNMPKALIIICFDSFHSRILETTIRNCSRGNESYVIHLVKQGDHNHRRSLSNTFVESCILQPHEPTTGTLSITSSGSPSHDDLDYFSCIQDPTTGRCIYARDSVDVVRRLVIGLNVQKEDSSQTIFEFAEAPSYEHSLHPHYTCVVSIPGLPKLAGPSLISKNLAQEAACYQVCLELFRAGLLDHRFFPPDTNSFHEFDGSAGSSNSHASNRSGTRGYLRKQPDFWTNVNRTVHNFLFPMVITIDHAAQQHTPIAILTRKPLPDMRSFNLFDSLVPFTVNLQKAAPLQVDKDRLENMYRYTLRVCRTVSNKPFECALENMSYFLVPLTEKWTARPTTEKRLLLHHSITEYIPWELVTLAVGSYALPFQLTMSQGANQHLENMVVQDRWAEFTRRYIAVKMRPDLNPLSKVADSPNEAKYENHLEFCKARVKGFEGLRDITQPLIEVSPVQPAANLLNPNFRRPTTLSKYQPKFLIPELSARFTIPTSTLLTALLLPSVTRRIDDFLLVKELNAKLFDQAISEDLLLNALCARSAALEYDYERLELLGDSFLKYLSTVCVFVSHPNFSEGALHSARQQLISNKSLFQHACRKGLTPYIQSKPFRPKSWRPPNFYLSGADPKPSSSSGDDNDDEDSSSITMHPHAGIPVSDQKRRKSSKKIADVREDTQWLGDKAIADVAEAIIGAAYLSGGREVALRATKALGVPIPAVVQWSDLGKDIASGFKTTAKINSNSLDAIETIVGHKLPRPDLIAQALTHSSIPSNGSISYERLEFIGDAILDFLVIRHVFNRETQVNPGGLTLLKGAMVSNAALAAACVWSGLHKFLYYESRSLKATIDQYVSKLVINQSIEYEAAERESRLPGQYWLGLEAPKTLSDVMESVIGAIYISDSFCPVGVEALFETLLKPFYDKHITLKTLSHHPTKSLFELLQARGCQRFRIRKERDKGGIMLCQVIVHEVILTTAEDQVATSAARRASLMALDALEGDPGFLMRTCDCRTKSRPTKKEQEEAQLLLELEEEQDMLVVEEELMKPREKLKPL